MASKPGNSRRMMENKENQSVARSQLKRKMPGELLDITNQQQISDDSEIPVKRQRKDNNEVLKDSSLNHDETHYDPAYVASGAFLKVPDEVVDKIFGLMNCEDKIAMSETCTRFNRIFSEPRSLKTIKLMVDMDTHYLPTFQRRYQHVEFKNIDLPRTAERSQDLKKFFASVGENVKDLIIHQSTFSDRYLAIILCSFPLITTLKITNSKITKTLSTSHQFRILGRLQNLHIQGFMAEAIAKVIENVETLEEILLLPLLAPDMRLGLDNRIRSMEDFEAFMTVIVRQQHLKTLLLSDGFSFESPFICQAQLKKLVLFIPSLSSNQSANLLNFLLTQNELEKSIFNVALRERSQEVQVSLLHILQLKTLHNIKIIFYRASEMDFAFRNSNIVNSNVVDLCVNFRDFPHSQGRTIKNFCKMFPNLKQLQIEIEKNCLEWTSSRIFKPLNSLKHLESLILENCDTRLITTLKLPKLKKFTMDAMVNSRANEWRTFLINNSNIEELSVDYDEVRDVSEEQLAIHLAESAVLHLRHLRTMKIYLYKDLVTTEFVSRFSNIKRPDGFYAPLEFNIIKKSVRV